jgi:hypothetical protein
MTWRLARGRQRPTEFWVCSKKPPYRATLQTALRSEKSRKIYVTVISELIDDAVVNYRHPLDFRRCRFPQT